MEIDGTTIVQIAVAVFAGNALTLSAYFALRHFMTVHDDKDAKGWAYLALLFPLGIAILTLIAAKPEGL